MKLLFDHNISPKLVNRLAAEFPGSTHVSLHALDRASDDEIWEFAKTNNLVIVTKDADFGDIEVLRGFPPKVLWLQLGNCTNQHIEDLLRSEQSAIEAFGKDQSVGTMALT
jgi:predicted nuclease of predicted toxin-antitoxin system